LTGTRSRRASAPRIRSAAFLPSAGRLQLLEWPHLQSVRVDAGFASGDTVPDCYDSLLGKIIAWAPTREQAAARLASGA